MKLIQIFLILLIYSDCIAQSYASGFYNIKNYGAKGDSVTLDTDAINKTIDEAAKAGGGTVFFPAGTYRSFSIRLKSNISLYFDQGSTLLAAEPNATAGYDPPEPNIWGDSLKYQDFGHSHWHNSLIWGENIENISILGPGIIYGKGLSRGGRRGNLNAGNKAIALKLCRNIIIRDVTILYGGHFAILATGVDNLTLDNLRIDTNRDGIDIDCCRNVRVSNLTVNSPWDDAICLKSSYALGFNRATENVTITNCQVTGFDRGTLYNGTYLLNETNLVPDKEGITGRIKFGTESNGGFKNITISNCVFEHCRGLALETVDGGMLEDITVSNITMRDIVNSPIFIRLGARMRAPDRTTQGKLRRINISNIVVYNAESRFSSIISGISGNSIEDVKLSNIRICYKGGGTKEMAAIIPAENDSIYPEPAKMGNMPSYGFYIRHVRNITFDNVEISFLKDDMRPPFVLDDVTNAGFRNVNAQFLPGIPSFVLKNSANIHISNSQNMKNIQLKKAGNKNL